MTPRRDQLIVLRLALALLSVAALAAFLELFARQAPYTPLALGLLPGPIQQLREAALVHALVAFLAALTLERAWPEVAPARFVGGLVAGHGLLFAVLLYAALSGRMAVQIWDPRPLAVGLTALRVVGHVAVVGCYFLWGRRLWRGPA